MNKKALNLIENNFIHKDIKNKVKCINFNHIWLNKLVK